MLRLLNNTLSEHRYQVNVLNVKALPNLEKFIPSAPALVVFDDKGTLAYLGPYSSGLMCSPYTSIVEPIVKQIVENKHFGAQIISQSQGCYCNT